MNKTFRTFSLLTAIITAIFACTPTHYKSLEKTDESYVRKDPEKIHNENKHKGCQDVIKGNKNGWLIKEDVCIMK